MSAREVLARMRERADRATPGRWKIWGMSVMADPLGTSNVDDCIDIAHTVMRDEHGKPRTFDAQFIAAARTDLPALVEIAQTLEGYVADLDEGEPMNADDVQVLRDLLDALEAR